MENAKDNALAHLRSLIGREFTDSPSPFGRWLKGQISAVDHGALAMTFKVREEFTNPMGYLHGGVIAAIADDMIGATILSSGLARQFMSLNLDVQYVAPAKLGDTIVAKTRLVDAGKRILTLDWSILGSGEELLARGSSQVFCIG